MRYRPATSKSNQVPLNYFYVSSIDDIAYYSTSLFLVMEVKKNLALEDSQKNNLADYIKSYQGTVVFLGLPGESTESLNKQLTTWFTDAGMQVKKQAQGMPLCGISFKSSASLHLA